MLVEEWSGIKSFQYLQYKANKRLIIKTGGKDEQRLTRGTLKVQTS